MSKKNDAKLGRREFLAGAGALTGYTLFVRAPQSLAGEGTGAQPAAAGGLRGEIAGRIDQLSPEVPEGLLRDEINMRRVDLEADVLVAGGGQAGVCAAIAAARNGARVILVQDRSRLGGNASSEVRMHIMGADSHNPGWREGGIIEEMRLENARWNPQHAWELWDLMLYDKVVSEPNITLLLDSSVYRADMKDGIIEAAWVRCDKTEHIYRVTAEMFIDATGDSRLALEAGAEYRVGREGAAEFGESLADYDAVGTTQGSSILFTARQYDNPMPYKAPKWARTITAADLQHRRIPSFEYGYWWIELGGVYDTIRDNERLRFELLAIVLGVWNYIKNSGKYPKAENWALETVGMIPGKRDSRRVIGDFINAQGDFEGGWRQYDTGVAIGGWAFDDHPAKGFDASDVRPYRPIKVPEPYNIAVDSLYSKNIGNLMMAGRNISSTHVAFTSARVMATCSVIGQAAGTCAALCVKEGVRPRELRQDPARLARLRQQLLRDDQTIRELSNEDPADLARAAKVVASSELMETRASNVLSGISRDLPGEKKNIWIGSLEAGEAWIELQWKVPQKIRHVQVTFDTGFERQLTLTASEVVRRRMIFGPQPEVVKDYTLTVIAPDGREQVVAEVEGNYQRLRRHDFEPMKAKAVRLTVKSTNGAAEARVYEMRSY